VGVAEPHQYRLERFLKAYGQTIPNDAIFSDWRELLAKDKVTVLLFAINPNGSRLQMRL
jgi:hypothetical protein